VVYIGCEYVPPGGEGEKKMKFKKQPKVSSSGSVQVTVQRENRLKAISDLAEAVKHVARALDNQTQVVVQGCHIVNAAPGIHIDTAEKVDRTEIKSMG